MESDSHEGKQEETATQAVVHMPVTLTPGRLRQEDHVVEASLGYTGSMVEG